MQDFCPIKRVDHLELFVGNAKQAATYYARSFGFSATAYRGLETGYRDAASYVLEQGHIRLVLTAPLSPGHPIAQFRRRSRGQPQREPCADNCAGHEPEDKAVTAGLL